MQKKYMVELSRMSQQDRMRRLQLYQQTQRNAAVARSLGSGRGGRGFFGGW